MIRLDEEQEDSGGYAMIRLDDVEVCQKCGLDFDECGLDFDADLEQSLLYGLKIKWGYWQEDSPGQYSSLDPAVYGYTTLIEALRCKCERCGFQWLVETEDAANG